MITESEIREKVEADAEFLGIELDDIQIEPSAIWLFAMLGYVQVGHDGCAASLGPDD